MKKTANIIKKILEKPKIPTYAESVQPCGISEVAFERTQEWQDFIKKSKQNSNNNKKCK